ncbi:DNA polymerase III subunit delta' [Macrococcus hajekii]|nr:DNA polymerase III subunit delta' [Macrococcus hajekii]GGB12746.1 DNA polymerase III subunit delta' [Macrococcus hajekii]
MINQLETLADKKKLSHAYLLEGIQREDIKQQAMDFAVRILCDDAQSESRIRSHNYADFYWLETEEQTIKKDMIEDVLHRMNQKPVEGRYKVYVIVDFDKLTVQGENSILKFLEEPPPNTVALLLTTQASHILPTIHSRCQHIVIQSKSTYEQMLKDHIHPDLASTLSALSFSSDQAQGWIEENEFESVRQATVKWADMMQKDSQMGLIQIVELLQIANERTGQLLLLDMLQLYFQDMIYIKVERSERLSFPDHQVAFEQLSTNVSLQTLTRWMDVVQQGKQKLLQYVSAMLVLEHIAIEIAKG